MYCTSKKLLRLKNLTFLNFLGLIRLTETKITSPNNAIFFLESPNTLMH